MKRLPDGNRSSHWHIDYLEKSPRATLRRIFLIRSECDVARLLGSQCDLAVLAGGLGASDCGPECEGHVLAGEMEPGETLERIEGSDVAPDGSVLFRSDRCEWVPVGEDRTFG